MGSVSACEFPGLIVQEKEKRTVGRPMSSLLAPVGRAGGALASSITANDGVNSEMRFVPALEFSLEASEVATEAVNQRLDLLWGERLVRLGVWVGPEWNLITPGVRTEQGRH